AVAAGQGVLLPPRPIGRGGLVEDIGLALQPRGCIAMRVAGAGAGAAGVFPFGFGGQAVAVAFGAAEPGGQRLGVVPGHVDDGVVVILGTAGVAPGVARVAPFEGIAADGGGGVVIG